MGSQSDPEQQADANMPTDEPPPEGGSSSPRPSSDHHELPLHDRTTPLMSSTSSPNPDVGLCMSVDGPTSPQSNPVSGWSNSNDRQLDHSRMVDPADRVFPIRSVISVDDSHSMPWALPRNQTEPESVPRDKDPRGARRSSRLLSDTDTPNNLHLTRTYTAPANPAFDSSSEELASPRRSPSGGRGFGMGPLPLFNDATSSASERTTSNVSLNYPVSLVNTPADRETPSEINESLITARFKHAITDEGHAVITGRDGTLQRCEDEPIHTPGAVQGFGLLVALREETNGKFTVCIVSENCEQVIGYSVKQLFRLHSFMDIFTEDQTDNFMDHIDFIRDDDADPAINGPEVFSLSLRRPDGRNIKMWCGLHIPSSHEDLIVCEFELEDDRDHPLRPPDDVIPPAPEDTLYQNPTIEEFTESTEVNSKPLRMLRNARKKRGEAGAMQVFDIMSQVQDQLASAPNLDKFLKILVGIVKELTGFHRVMIYQFDASFNGKVVTELVDPMHTRDLYKGLNFPASDIPKQARDLYKLNKVRLLYDRDLESARLVCRTVAELERPLDLSHAYLRAMSPIHLKYLANMAVRASMSISINAFNELWGLIACHSYGPRGMRVNFPIRKMCRLVGDTASRNIERLSYASRLQARKLINTVPTERNPSGYIIASSDDLLKLFDADFGMLSIGGETKMMGKVEQTQEALAMLEYLRMRKFTAVLTTQDIIQDLPDLKYAPGFYLIAGLLYVPLSVGGQDFIVFFRKGQVKEVKWAGNPYEKVIREGTTEYLEPRSSFQVWHETVLGKCREWSDEEVETAAVLCLVYGKFIEVWRQKEAALQNSRLTRLLLANSAHEVRTPLNAIINYLEIALEGSLDQETRDNLAKSHSASKSLVYVINDLLDLTKTEEGQELVKDEIFDLPGCLQEATEPFTVDAKRKSIKYEVIEHPGLPHLVHGDHPRLRQAIANMTANAFQHTIKGFVRVECYVVAVVESTARVEISVEDTGCGMSNEQLDALFRDLEQVEIDGEESKAAGELLDLRDARNLGLGLAVVARIIRNMDGQLRLRSEKGKGSRFVLQLPFELPNQETIENRSPKSRSNTDSGPPSVTKTLPPTEAGEVMLVDSTAVHVPMQTLGQRKSLEDMSAGSLRSMNSRCSERSIKSDADRLIDAIQTPLSIGEAESPSTSMYRQSSTHSQHRRSAGEVESRPTCMQRQSSTSSQHRRSFNNLELLPATNMSHAEPSSQNASSALRKATLVYSPDIQNSPKHPVGMTFVTDTKTPIKAVKAPDDYQEQSSLPQSANSSKVLFELSATPTSDEGRTSKNDGAYTKLQVLIAEDDPINMKILRKRLDKAGHHVSPTVNGEDCATVYRESPQTFDVILMDMQMPIVDGLTSTKMIRAFEKSGKCIGLSSIARRQGRVPIFAVSASLVERERLMYMDAGFDGWILKPIDFKRLHTLLDGITDDIARNDCLYVQGNWERGGWFGRRNVAPTSSSLDASSQNSSPEDVTPPSPISPSPFE